MEGPPQDPPSKRPKRSSAHVAGGGAPADVTTTQGDVINAAGASQEPAKSESGSGSGYGAQNAAAGTQPLSSQPQEEDACRTLEPQGSAHLSRDQGRSCEAATAPPAGTASTVATVTTPVPTVPTVAVAATTTHHLAAATTLPTPPEGTETAQGLQGHAGGAPGAPPAAMPPRPQRYLLTVEYMGTSFFGFQRQPNVPTVQGALETALRQLMGEPAPPAPPAPPHATPSHKRKAIAERSQKHHQAYPTAHATAHASSDTLVDSAVQSTAQATVDSAVPASEHSAPGAPSALTADRDTASLAAGDTSGAPSVSQGGTTHGRAGSHKGDLRVKPLGSEVTPAKLLDIVGSSRTDTGVHALGNTCHVDILRRSKRKQGQLLEPFSPKALQKGLNHFLTVAGADVSVVSARAVGPEFHARFAATQRTYFYRLHASPDPPSIFDRTRVWHVPGALDLGAMRAACAVLQGRHDFSSFRASGCQALSPVKSLYELSIHPAASWMPLAHPLHQTGGAPDSASHSDARRCGEGTGLHGEADSGREAGSDRNGEGGVSREGAQEGLVIVARAQSFLYHQVRLLVGTLKAVGTGAKSVEDVKILLKARNITRAPAMAPAHGLYLAHVKYPSENDEEHHEL